MLGVVCKRISTMEACPEENKIEGDLYIEAQNILEDVKFCQCTV
jgi:hypothetical protein